MAKRTLVTLAVVTAVFAVLASSALAASATTKAAKNVTSTQADLAANLVGQLPYGYDDLPNEPGTGGNVWYAFQYGTTTQYGNMTPTRGPLQPQGWGGVDVTEHITGLSPDTTYHFRVGMMAEKGHEGAGGGFFGEDMTFTTEPLPRFQSVSCPACEFKAKGSLSKKNAFEFTIPSAILEFRVQCESVALESAGLVTPPYSPDLTLENEHDGCETTFEGEPGYEIVIDNSCRYGTSVISGPPYTGYFGLGCYYEEEEELEIHYLNSQESPPSELCTISIPEQGFTSGVSYENKGEGTGATVREHVSQGGIDYTEEGAWCDFFVDGNGTDGHLEYTADLGAYDESGKALGLRIVGMSK